MAMCNWMNANEGDLRSRLPVAQPDAPAEGRPVIQRR